MRSGTGKLLRIVLTCLLMLAAFTVPFVQSAALACDSQVLTSYEWPLHGVGDHAAHKANHSDYYAQQRDMACEDMDGTNVQCPAGVPCMLMNPGLPVSGSLLPIGPPSVADFLSSVRLLNGIELDPVLRPPLPPV